MDYEAMANKIMPELGQDIEDFKYNTWNVTNWRNLEKRITGPEFEVGSWKWRILLFPFGNGGGNQDVVSIYLDFVDIKNAPPGWHSCAQFALVLWNPEDPTQYISYHAHHRFTAEEQDWGFTRFYSSQKLFTPCENRPHALIKNDSTNITAFIRVFKDPTGILWHNLNNYDSKKETGYVGLINQGTTGYMNTFLQLLYCITYFRKAIYQIPTEDDKPTKSIPLALQRIFYNLQISDMPVVTRELTESLGFGFYKQIDLQEFSKILHNILKIKMKGTKVDGTHTKLFVGKIKEYIKCINLDYESSHVEDYYDIQLNVKGCKTLSDSLKNYIQEEILEGDNKYEVEGHGLQDVKKGVIFESFPPILHLQLKRFEYDILEDTMVKINYRFEYPMEIDLEEFLSEDADRSNSHKYLLHGVLVFSGGAMNKGHCFAILKPEKDGKWFISFKFDDDQVTPVIDKQVLEDNYGGLNFTNAYILIYIRESNIDEILSPVVPEDIPFHLRRICMEEKMVIEEQEKERIEENLTIKVVTTEKLKNYQGFDLANFDEAHKYKIQKGETYGAFKENVSQAFNILPEQVRFWIFVNRRNKTIRPDFLIPESYSNISMEEVHKRMTSHQNEMKLYMETDNPFNDTIWLPEGNDHIIVFLKYFDPDKQAFEGLGHLYIQKFSEVGDYARIFCEKKKLPPDTLLKIYEEIKPGMIVKMSPDLTFQKSEVKDGGIICFQKVLTVNEIYEYKVAGRYVDIPDFYKSLIIVSFKPKFKNQEQRLKFDLVLGKKCSYNMISESVAAHLNTDPLKLRFTSVFSSSGIPKSVIKQTTTQTLSEMLQTSYLNPSAYVLFYEILEISTIEPEAKKFFKVYWLGNIVKEKEVIGIHLKENTIINDFIEEISKKVTLSSPSSRIRLFEVRYNKIQKDFIGSEPIESIKEFETLYAEEIPLDEIVINQYDQIIQVCHFTNDPVRLHGIPFKFVIKNGEKLADTKLRLRQRLGMNEKDFSKVKISIISETLYVKPEYFYNDDIILSEKLSNEEFLGLDYVDNRVKLEVQKLF